MACPLLGGLSSFRVSLLDGFTVAYQTLNSNVTDFFFFFCSHSTNWLHTSGLVCNLYTAKIKVITPATYAHQHECPFRVRPVLEDIVRPESEQLLRLGVNTQNPFRPHTKYDRLQLRTL